MQLEALPSEQGEYNLQNYDETYKTFQWIDVERNFTWHKTGKINMAYEAIDKHAESFRKNKVALFYRDENRFEKYTFKEMKEWSNRVGNVLKDYGVTKGERVFIFMPRAPELYFSLLGIIKLGAIAGPLFQAFMEDGVRDRLKNSGAKYLITTSELLHRVPVDDLPELEKIFVVGDEVEENDTLVDFYEKVTEASKYLNTTWVEREDGLILHYTSGSTGKPKGVLHVHNAMLQHYITAKWVLDLREEDIYWCTADPGWVTGTSYGVFGPWLLGISNVVLGGKFSPEAWYETIENLGVTVWYSAPTAFRMLMGAGDALANEYELTSLRHILSVGEPLNPEVIGWGMKVFGQRIHDNWWMTETGAIMISNFPCMEIRPGSMGKPIPGVTVGIVDDKGNELPPYQMGHLAIKKGWPSMIRQIWNNRERYESYFLPNGWYISGDSAYVDSDGYFWYQGRIDDVIITSGERVGPFEVESKLIEHPAVAEAGIIGKPDPVRGEIIKAFITLHEGYEATEELKEEIRHFVKHGLASYAAPQEIEFMEKLPKTRSGKIMRRVLKSIELNS